MTRPGFMKIGQLESERVDLQRQARVDYCVRKWRHILKIPSKGLERSLRSGGLNHLFYLCVCNSFKQLSVALKPND